MKETFAEYTSRMLALAEGADPIAVLTATPDRIGALIAGRSAVDLQRGPAPGRWSVAEIVHHLADSEIVFAYRVRMILSASGTAIQAFDQDAWSRSQRAAESDAHASLALMRPLRAAQVAFASRLSDEELDRFGMHSERGRESIRHMLRMYAGHDRNHVAQIERLLGASSAEPAKSKV